MLEKLVRKPWQKVAAIPGRWQAYAESAHGRKWLRIGRIALTTGVIGYLVYELIRLDVLEVVRALPVEWGFYGLAIVIYFLLPAMQVTAYRIVWRFPIRKAIGAFVIKRILNKDVLGYSGEVYIYTWAREHVKQSDRALMETVRDMNILSAAASTGVAAILVTIFALNGRLNVRDLIGDAQVAGIAGAVAFTAILLVVVVRLRKYLFSMPRKPASLVFALHVGRQILRQFLEIAMWHVALPDIPLAVWFTYAAVSIIVTRIPFMPSHDLVIMGMAVGLSGALSVPEPAIFAMFGAVVVLHRLISLLVFVTVSAWPRHIARDLSGAATQTA